MGAGKVHIIRHGHALHNVHNDLSIPDPRLTQLGRDQSENLRINFPFSKPPPSVAIVMTSPLKRAVETALIAFSEIIDKRFYPKDSGKGIAGGVELVLDPYLQERGSEPANTGSPVPELKQIWPDLDYLTLGPHWELKQGDFAIDEESIAVRAKKVRQVLMDKSNNLEGEEMLDIAVVTHGGFIMSLTGDDALELGQTAWRSFAIEEDNEGQPKLSPILPLQ